MRRTVCNMLCISLLLTSASCLEETFSSGGKSQEADARIATDVERVGLPAEFIDAQDTVFTVTVTSNRSWFVHLNDVDNPVDPSDVQASVSWASVDLDDHENLTMVDDQTQLNVTVSRNLTQDARNGVLNFYCGGDVVLSLPIVQAGAVYRLSAVPESPEALCTAGQLSISVESNTSWNAELLPQTTAAVSLTSMEGFDSGQVSLDFEENFDLFPKKAYVRFYAQDCEDVIVEVTQSEALPYMILDQEKTTSGRLPADVSEAVICLKTNLSGVTAVIKEGGQLTDAVLEKVSDREFRLKFTPDGTEPLIFKKSTVVVSADMAEDIEVEFSQNGRLYFDFKVADNISPVMPTASSADYTSHVLTVGENKYDFGFKTFYYREANVLMFYKGGYITLPALEGLTLKKITFYFRGHTTSQNRAPRLTIKGVDADAETLYSESNVSFEVPANVNEYATCTLEVGTEKNRPQPGVAYRICQHSGYSCQVRYMWLQYE